MAWLGTWAKRAELTVDHTNIDGNLTWYPVPLFINATSGQSNDDLTEIFDDLGANSLKIAVTKADGTTEIYVEVEQWDNGAEEAILHVSKSDLVVTTAGATTLYIYFDPTEDDNAAMVAVVGDRTEVWDGDFEAVYHLADDDTGTTVIDSTSNNKDATKKANADPSQDTGIVGLGQRFDGADDHISLPAIFNNPTEYTIQVMGHLDDDGLDQRLIAYNDDGIFSGIHMHAEATVDRAMGNSWDGDMDAQITDDGYDLTDPHLYALTAKDNDFVELWIDGVSSGQAAIGLLLELGGGGRQMGSNRSATGSWVDGLIDETRFSSVVRSDDWNKADHYALTDNLLEFGAVEALPVETRVIIPTGEIEITGYAPTVVAEESSVINPEK